MTTICILPRRDFSPHGASATAYIASRLRIDATPLALFVPGASGPELVLYSDPLSIDTSCFSNVGVGRSPRSRVGGVAW
jgi:hypothetical protein